MITSILLKFVKLEINMFLDKFLYTFNLYIIGLLYEILFYSLENDLLVLNASAYCDDSTLV